MAYERKFEKVDLDVTVIDTANCSREEAWEAAINHVKMGIAVTPIMVHEPAYDDNGLATATYGDDKIMHGAYVTESGRDGQYYMVMVDRNNDNEWKALTPCSDYYAAVAPAMIYENLQKMLESTKSKPTYVYNSYNGGSQQLRVRVEDIDTATLESVDGYHMEIVLKTSLDKSSNHSMSVIPVSADGQPLLFTDTGKSGFNFRVRHTNGAKAEIVNFNAAVASIANTWNSQIVPYVKFLADGEFSETDIYALLSNVLEDAKLPKDLNEEITGACKASVDTSKAGSGLTLIKTISEHVLSRNATPMAQHRDTDKVSKAITTRVRQLFDKKLKSLN